MFIPALRDRLIQTVLRVLLLATFAQGRDEAVMDSMDRRLRRVLRGDTIASMDEWANSERSLIERYTALSGSVAPVMEKK